MPPHSHTHRPSHHAVNLHETKRREGSGHLVGSWWGHRKEGSQRQKKDKWHNPLIVRDKGGSSLEVSQDGLSNQDRGRRRNETSGPKPRGLPACTASVQGPIQSIQYQHSHVKEACTTSLGRGSQRGLLNVQWVFVPLPQVCIVAASVLTSWIGSGPH